MHEDVRDVNRQGRCGSLAQVTPVQYPIGTLIITVQIPHILTSLRLPLLAILLDLTSFPVYHQTRACPVSLARTVDPEMQSGAYTKTHGYWHQWIQQGRRLNAWRRNCWSFEVAPDGLNVLGRGIWCKLRQQFLSVQSTSVLDPSALSQAATTDLMRNKPCMSFPEAMLLAVAKEAAKPVCIDTTAVPIDRVLLTGVLNTQAWPGAYEKDLKPRSHDPEKAQSYIPPRIRNQRREVLLSSPRYSPSQSPAHERRKRPRMYFRHMLMLITARKFDQGGL